MTVPEQGFRRRFHSQVAWYLVVGAIGFGADALAYLLFAKVLGWPAVPARLAAFLPATVITWWINRHYTFSRLEQPATHWGWEYLRYLAVQGTGIAINFVVFQSVISRSPEHDLAGFALGSAIALLFNFAGSRWLVFTGQPGDVSLLAVALFGALSVLLGQDANWDLANYHLYNAHAFVTGRLQTDFAAAGLQTYFNPLLDLPYYGLALHLPAPTVAFLMGALHGVAFLLVAGIVRRVLPMAPAKEVWLLAAAGCLGATFLSELGNTMGDNTTALLVLAALLLCLWAQPAATVQIAAAGLLVGAATGLKLTNAPYAIGLAAGWMALPIPIAQRLRAVGVLTLAGIAGLALTSGYWFWRMGTEFGNPLFPQFNAWFGSPLAASIAMADARWGPKSVFEALVYPFVFTLNPKRWGETPLVQLLWPVAYVLLLAWLVLAARRRTVTPPGNRFLYTFLAISYLGWLAAFGIGRYTVAMELLLPLAVWLLLQQAWPSSRARTAGKLLIAIAVVASVLPLRSWGHAPFAQRSYAVPPLPIAQPSRATVLFLAQPVAWMAVFWPAELAFVSMFNFPESPGGIERAKSIMRSRGGEVWAVLPAAADTAANTVAKFNDWSQGRALPADGWTCRAVQRGIRASSRYRAYQLRAGGGCQFELPAAQRRDLAAEDRAIAQHWAGLLGTRGLSLQAASCRRQEGFIGADPLPFQICRVTG